MGSQAPTKNHWLRDSPAAGKRSFTWIALCFAAVCISAAWQFTARTDIGLYDETAYLERGLVIAEQGLPTADMAPLYSMWYAFLHLFIPDPVDIYLFNHAFTIAALPLIVLALLRALGVGLSASVLTASLLLLSTLNVLSWPRVSLFALIIVLIALLLFIKIPRRTTGLGIVVLCTTAAMYVRPEFVLALVPFTGWWLWIVFFTKGGAAGTRLRAFLPVATASSLLVLVFGDPLAHGRSGIAFGQHYALNKVEATGSAVDPWTNWEHIVAADFGPVSGLAAAFVAAPGRVAWHVQQNLIALPEALTFAIVPAGVTPTNRVIGFTTLLGMALLFLAFRRWRQQSSLSKSQLIVAAVLALPALTSTVLIHPRMHYMLFPVCSGTIIIIALIFHERQGSLAISIATLALTAAATPVIGEELNDQGRPVMLTIEALRGIALRPGLNVMDADGGYGTYLQGPSTRVKAQDKNEPFASWSRHRPLDVIIVSPRARQDERYSDDPTWATFYQSGYAEAYERIAVPGTDVEVFIARTAVLKR